MTSVLSLQQPTNSASPNLMQPNTEFRPPIRIGVGVDIGMTYSGAWIYYETYTGYPFSEHIPLEGALEDRKFPSLVYIHNHTLADAVVGTRAREVRPERHPGKLFPLFKRDLGTTWLDTMTGQQIRAVTLTRFLLIYLLERVQQFLHAQNWDMYEIYYTFTHPGMWDEDKLRDFQTAINEAFEHSKMDARHVRMMEEPVAAAVGIAQLEGNFGVLSPHQKILICDLGGGTLDMSIVTPTLTEDIRVKAAPGGDGDLGMSNLDKILALHLMRRQGLLASADATTVETVLSRPIVLGQELDDAWKAAQTLMNDPAWCGMLLQRCEALKRRICNTWTTLDEWVVVMPRGEQVVVVRDEVAPYFAAMNDAVAAATVRYLDDLRTAEAVQLSAQDITSVLVVGGGSRLPNIRETLVRKLPSATVRQINDREVTSLVQRGAACCAFRPETILERRCNSSYGVYTWSEKPPKYPDYFKRGEIKPRENGPARLYPTYERLLRRHDPLPVAPVKRVLQPIEDGLDEVQIPVLQGENEDPDQNKKVGTVILSQRKNASHRDAFVVEFFLGDDGLMHAQGRDKTGQISGRVTWSVDIS